MMTGGRLAELISSFPSRRIVVVGDYFLDKYLEFDPALAEISLETGKTAHQVVSVRRSPGAAGTVVSNLIALGAGEVVAVGFTGDDGEGYDLRRNLRDLGCKTDYLLNVPERYTPTYLKPKNCRISELEGETERFDTKNRLPLPSDVQDAVIDLLETLCPQVDAVIVADQVEEEGCGVITAAVRSALAELADEFPEVAFWVDSRRRIGLFHNVILKPNRREAIKAVFTGYEGRVDDEMVLEAGRALRVRSGKPVFVTCAERGIVVFDEKGHTEVRGIHIDGPTDPTGAGDSATAAAVLTLASGGKPVEAALVANLVASITVEQLGTTGAATPDLLSDRFEVWRSQGDSTGVIPHA